MATDSNALSESALQDLAERIEAADGPDRELDGDIAEAVGAVPPFVHRRDSPEWGSWSGGRDHWDAPAYTGSLDAAVTLVPEGYSFNLGNDVRGWADVWFDVPVYDGKPYEGRAATPALALCAASLRARHPKG